MSDPRDPAAPILLNDFRAQWPHVREAVLGAVERVGESGWFVLGQEVAGFEKELAQAWGLPHCVGCASGLDAIEIALRCAGLAPGDAVLTTPLSAFARREVSLPIYPFLSEGAVERVVASCNGWRG